MNREQSWKQEDIKTLVEMWKNGDAVSDIANKLNKWKCSFRALDNHKSME